MNIRAPSQSEIEKINSVGSELNLLCRAIGEFMYEPSQRHEEELLRLGKRLEELVKKYGMLVRSGSEKNHH